MYVHIKLLDDRLAIIGSANLNDRSLLGSCDSEIATMIKEKRFARSVDGRGGRGGSCRC
jgi:phospholipase D1/2